MAGWLNLETVSLTTANMCQGDCGEVSTVPPSSHGVAPAHAQVDRERAYVYNTP